MEEFIMKIDVSSVYQTWINSLSSENTIKKYKSSVTLFCSMVFQKEPETIEQYDLFHLRFSDVLNKFVTPLKQAGVKDTTIKGHLIAVRSYIKMINREKIFRDIDYTNLLNYVLTDKSLKTNDVKHHEAISKEELEELKKFLREKRYKNDINNNFGKKYALLVDFMYKTGIRVNASFHIKWIDFQFVVGNNSERYARLDVIDKGQKLNTKYLRREYYDMLRNLFYRDNDNDFVFDGLSQNALREYFKEFSQKINHHLTPHSLRAGAATSLYYQTKDILMVKDFLDHENIATTEKYIHSQKDPSSTGTAILTADYDYSDIDKLSKEQLLMLIHSRPEMESSIYMTARQSKLITR